MAARRGSADAGVKPPVPRRLSVRFGARVPAKPAYADAFQAIGPAAIKLGQTLATRPDLVGDPDTGVLAGGLVTTLLDHIGGLAVWTAMDAFHPIATLDLRVDYMRAARPGVDLLAQASCYRLTPTIAFVRGWAFEDDPADPVAAAQSAYVLNRSRSSTKPAPAGDVGA